jgi:hypothetical protein
MTIEKQYIMQIQTHNTESLPAGIALAASAVSSESTEDLRSADSDSIFAATRAEPAGTEATVAEPTVAERAKAISARSARF